MFLFFDNGEVVEQGRLARCVLVVSCGLLPVCVWQCFRVGRGVNDTLIFIIYSGSVREKFEFISVIVEPSSNSSSSSYRASRIRVY